MKWNCWISIFREKAAATPDAKTSAAMSVQRQSGSACRRKNWSIMPFKQKSSHYACEKPLVLSDKRPNTKDYPNKGKPIPGCRFGYTYGNHPPKTDDQLAAQKKSSKTSASKSRWEKIKGHVSNAIQALQVGTETAGAPAGTGEMVGLAKVGTELLTNLNLQAKYTNQMVGELEKKTGETRLDLYFQIQDCISKQDFSYYSGKSEKTAGRT